MKIKLMLALILTPVISFALRAAVPWKVIHAKNRPPHVEKKRTTQR